MTYVTVTPDGRQWGPRISVMEPLAWASSPHGRCRQITRNSAIADRLRDASCQLKFANCHATVQKLLVRQVERP